MEDIQNVVVLWFTISDCGHTVQKVYTKVEIPPVELCASPSYFDMLLATEKEILICHWNFFDKFDEILIFSHKY